MKFASGCLLLLLFLIAGCSVLRPERSSQYRLYRVQPGDSVALVAERFQLSMVDLISANDLDDPSAISPGQKLYLPMAVQAAPPTGAARARYSSFRDRISLGVAKREVGRLRWPTKASARLSSRFGWRGGAFHEGMDLAAKTGTPVYAAHDGKVVYSGKGMRGYGNIVVIKGVNLLSVYAHNHKNRVRRGVRINRGEHIADVGSTGRSTGPHLHFETRVRDSQNRYVAVDPLVFFPSFR